MTADPLIIEQARSADPDARQKAAFLVAHSADERNLPLMFELLGDKDWRVRKTIVDGLVRDARPEIIQGLLDALADAENAGKRNSATEALIRIGETAIEPIVSRLRAEKDIDVRLSLVNLIGDLRSREGFDILIELLEQESDINVASSIVSSLGKYRDASALPHLMRALRTREDLWLKFHVVEALGEIGDRSALPAILPLYAEKSLRKPVLEAVGKIADVGTVNFLLRIIADEEKLNLTALRALVRIAEASKPRIVEQAERQLIQSQLPRILPATESRTAHRTPAHDSEARSESVHPQVSRMDRRRKRAAGFAAPSRSSRYLGSRGAGAHRLRPRRDSVDSLDAAERRGRRDRRVCCCAS